MSVNLRVGQGFDVRALVEGRPLIIGGVTLSHTHGLQGHSDADVLLHAITDAIWARLDLEILAAIFLIPIPPIKALTAARYYGKRCGGWGAGWEVVNVDATIHAQAPKMSPYAAAMAANVAQDLGILPRDVNVKAKTNEGLGFLGRKEGIAVTAVALLAAVER